MRIAITGTPGVGKTTVTKKLESKYKVFHLNEMVDEKDLSKGFDEKRDANIVNIGKLEKVLPRKGILESHFSHQLSVDRIIILRCNPSELGRRLRHRYEGSDIGAEELEKKVFENMEAEALDVILIESLQSVEREKVDEIDTTDVDPEKVARMIEMAIEGEKRFEPGKIDWSSWIEEV